MIGTHNLQTHWCGTGRRRLFMWEIGVEGDKFNAHLYNDKCEESGCVPLDRRETIRMWATQLVGLTSKVRIADEIENLLSCENMK